MVIVSLRWSTDVGEIGVTPIGSMGFTLSGIVLDDWVLVEGVEKAVEVSTLVPDDLSGHPVNNESEEDGEPGSRVSRY